MWKCLQERSLRFLQVWTSSGFQNRCCLFSRKPDRNLPGNIQENTPPPHLDVPRRHGDEEEAEAEHLRSEDFMRAVLYTAP